MIKHIHVGECDSTQDLLKEQLSGFRDSQGILVSCERQVKGRGRGDHTWDSLPGSLCFSLTVDPHPVPSFTAIEMSVLIAKFFEGSILTLKWPNDIWNKHGKKCCGVLVQNFNGVMIAGIGLNLFSDHPLYGGIYDSSFTFDKNSWSFEVAKFIQSNRYKNTEDLKRDWLERCGHLGEPVVITEGDTELAGVFKGIGVHGEALLETPVGEKRIYNGSLRPIPVHS